MSQKFSIPAKANADYFHRSLKVSGDPNWTFNGTLIISESFNVGGDDGYEWVTTFGYGHDRKKKNAVIKPGIDTTLTLYQTVGGSYIATTCVEPPGTNKAKIIETVEDLKSFFGNSNKAKHIYELLARQNPNIATALVGDFMKVIK